MKEQATLETTRQFGQAVGFVTISNLQEVVRRVEVLTGQRFDMKTLEPGDLSVALHKHASHRIGKAPGQVELILASVGENSQAATPCILIYG